jgi:glutamate-1-semialdehyde 2,1-aminomutase
MEGEGTFNGNPLSMAAARVVLSEILVPEAYVRLEELGRSYADGLRDAIDRHGVPASVSAVGCRGSVHQRAGAPRNYREAVDADADLATLAWLFQINAGVFVPSGDPWTIGIAHTEDDLTRSVEAFDAFATAITA